MNKICCIFNVAPHYNSTIYKRMDMEIGCDFYLGDKIHTPLELMDYTSLSGYTVTVKNISLVSHFYWQKGVLGTIFRSYNSYVLTGEPYCVSTWGILLLSRIFRKKTYLWTHGWYGNETIIKSLIKKLFFRLASNVLLYGNYARDLMIREGFNADRCVVVYNSLNDEKLFDLRRGLTENDIYKEYFNNCFPVLIYIGRIQKVKKLDVLLEAMSVLKQEGKPNNLIIIGKEIEGVKLEEKIMELGLERNVWRYGACYDESKLCNLIFNADLCVSPGNVGLTAIHSMFFGTPVVTHDNFKNQMPEFEAIKPGVTGDFFREDSVESLAKTIDQWLIGHPDKSIVRQACFDIIDSKYNSSVQIEILKDILK